MFSYFAVRLLARDLTIGIPTQGRPHAEPFSSSINPIAFSDVQRYVLGANIIEHVTNSKANLPVVYMPSASYMVLATTFQSCYGEHISSTSRYVHHIGPATKMHRPLRWYMASSSRDG